MRMRDLSAEAARSGTALPASYHRFYRVWFAFGFSASLAVLAIFRRMIARPYIPTPF